MTSNLAAPAFDLQSLAGNLDAHFANHETVRELTAELSRELLRREIYFGESLLPSFPKPDLLSRARERYTAAKVEAFVALLERVGRQILADRDLLRHIGFSAAQTDLLEIDPGFERLIVVSRLDMSCVGRCTVFEINTDSPAMMTFSDHLEDILLSTSIGDVLNVPSVRYRLTSIMLEGLLECYREWGGRKKDPTIAIVDWPGEMTASELRHTAAAFIELGYPTVVCNPSELSISGGAVHARGHQIDIIQRRVLFPDFIRRADELKTFTEAYRRGLVCVANPLRSIVVGNKAVLALLSERPDLLDISSADRVLINDLIPQTIRVTPSMIDTIRSEKDLWVLKGSLGSGGKAVSLGVAASSSAWDEVCSSALDVPTVAQRRQPIPILKIPFLDNGVVEMRSLFANWNPWVFGGRYAGASTRVSREKIVSISAGGGLLPVIAI